MLISAILILIPILFISILGGKFKNAWLGELLVGMTLAGFCVALGWFPAWFFVVLIVLVSLMYADKLSNLAGGVHK